MKFLIITMLSTFSIFAFAKGASFSCATALAPDVDMATVGIKTEWLIGDKILTYRMGPDISIEVKMKYLPSEVDAHE